MAAMYAACACCASSSTTSVSGTDVPRVSAVRTRSVQSMVTPLEIGSGRCDARHPVQCPVEALPDRPLAGERACASLGQPVIAAAALAGFLDPATFDEVLVFHAVQRRIER